MRCEKCRKEITGIGKPAVPPAVPAILAWGGAIWAMWSLTLGENPLPGWTPNTGWAVGLTTLAAATVLTWLALVRRKCPECGSTRMLQAMEEEGVLATERQTAIEQAARGLRPEAETELRRSLEENLRSAIEAEVRVAATKDAAELRARLEKELRDEIGQQMRAGQVESERGLRDKLSSELRPEIEREVRPRIEENLRSEIEKELRPRIEEKLRPEIERELRPRIEEKLRPEIERELRPRIEEKPRPEIDNELRATALNPVLSEPEEPKARPPVVETVAKVNPESGKDLGKPASSKTASGPAATPAPVPELPVPVMRTSPARSTPAPAAMVTPTPSSLGPGSANLVTASKTPAPVTVKPGLPGMSKTPAPATVKPGLPGLSKTPSPVATKPTMTEASKTPAPVLVKPAVPEASRTPAPLSTKPMAPASKAAQPTPRPMVDKSAVTPGIVTDPRERAERRARVIVSDLSLYHKDLLKKAAQADDPQKELGTLWRDAVLAYNRTVPPDVRASSNYLEDELNKYLIQLRKSQSVAANAPQG